MLRRILPAVNAIFVGHMIPRVGSIILVPLFLKTWSATLYGEYLALFAAVSYLSSLDIGMQQASVNRLTQLYAKGDLAGYRTVQHTTLAFYMVLATAITGLVAVFTWMFPLPQWIGLKLTNSSTAKAVIVLLAAYVMWSLPVRLIVASYQSTGNLARTQWISNLQQVCVVALSAMVLIAGGGMLSIAVLQLATVGFIAGLVLFNLRHMPALFPGIAVASLSMLKDLAHPSLLFALLLVGNLIAFQGSTLIVSAVIGGLAVAVLSISKAIIDLIRQVLYSITLALCPDFARMEALGKFEQLRRVHRMAVAATAAITLALASSVWYEGPQIINVWTRGRIEPDVMLLRLFLVLLAFQTPWAASSTVGTATNRHATQAIGYFCAAVIGVCLIAILVRRLGTWAVPVGLTLGEAVCCYHFVIKATCRTVGDSYKSFALRFWSGFFTIGAAVLGVGWVTHNVMPGPMLMRWTETGVFTLLTASSLGWILWLPASDRALILEKASPVLDACVGRITSRDILKQPSAVQELTR